MYLSYLDVHPVIEQMLFCLTLCSDLHSQGYSEYSLDKILLLPLFRDFSAHTEANSQRRSMCARHCVRVWINGVYVCSTKQLSVTKRKYSLYSSHDKELSIYHLFSMCTHVCVCCFQCLRVNHMHLFVPCSSWLYQVMIICNAVLSIET